MSRRRWLLAAALVGSGALGCGFGRARVTFGERQTIERRLQPAGVPSNLLARRGHQPDDLLAQAARGNAVVDDWKVARFGQLLFFYDGFTAMTDQGMRKTSCASCHDPNKNFSDGLARSVGAAGKPLDRRSPSIRTAAHRSFLFWDGRADSLWAQALAPYENMLEVGSNRGRIASTIATDARLAAAYELAFGEPPPAWLKAGIVDALPRPLELKDVPQEVASNPEKSVDEKGPNIEALKAQFTQAADDTRGKEPPPAWFAAWDAMATEGRQDAVNAVFVRVGKAIEAYEQRLAARGSKFDAAMSAIAAKDVKWFDRVLTEKEQYGLRLFVGKARCVNCHQGPDLTDEQFHYLGLPPTEGVKAEDTMWMQGAVTLFASTFRCDRKFGDGCGKAASRRLTGPRSVETLAKSSLAQQIIRGRVRTPSLRDTATNSHWMHGGHLTSLEQVIDFYDDPGENPEVTRGQRRMSMETNKQRERRGDAPFPTRADDSKMVQFRRRDFRMSWLSRSYVKLNEKEKQALIAFLGTLTSAPVDPSLVDPDAGGFGAVKAPAPSDTTVASTELTPPVSPTPP